MKMEQGARIIVERWLQAKPDDVLHFITDETKLREMEAFSAAAEGCGAVPKVSVLPSDSVQSGDSIEEMRHIMSYANAIVGATFGDQKQIRHHLLPASCGTGDAGNPHRADVYTGILTT